jgi:hypothetical protein
LGLQSTPPGAANRVHRTGNIEKCASGKEVLQGTLHKPDEQSRNGDKMLCLVADSGSPPASYKQRRQMPSKVHSLRHVKRSALAGRD